MAVSLQALEARIREHVPDVVHVRVEPLTPDGHHLQATVVSKAFEGRTRVEQHRMVYQALGELMQAVHALALRTYTPGAWSETAAADRQGG